ncbi:MAG: sensor histidine kinase [bacterium]
MRDQDKTREQLRDELAALRERFANQAKQWNEQMERRIEERTSKFQKMYEELKSLDEAKDRFLSSVTHELRTPLTSIRSFAEILVNYPHESAKTRREFYLIIKRESERLSRLIDDVLDLSKIRSGKMEWHLKRLNVGSVIQKAIDAVSCLILEKDLRLVKEINERLPAFSADEDRIIQVLTNLLGNAIKFTAQGGEIRIAANLLKGRRVEDERNLIHVSISDTGMGISKEDLSRIFDDYTQCPNTLSDTAKGTGLGLPICKEIVSRHRGNIWVESGEGKGSTFHITLPVEGLRICYSTRESEGSPRSDQEENSREPLH